MVFGRAVCCVGVMAGTMLLAPSPSVQAIDCNAKNSRAIDGLITRGAAPETVGPVTLNAGDRMDFTVTIDAFTTYAVRIGQTAGPGAPRSILAPTFLNTNSSISASFTASSSANNYQFIARRTSSTSYSTAWRLSHDASRGRNVSLLGCHHWASLSVRYP